MKESGRFPSVEVDDRIVNCVHEFLADTTVPRPASYRSENGFQNYYCNLLDKAWSSFLEEGEVPVKMECRTISARNDLKFYSARKSNRREADIAYGFKTTVKSLKVDGHPMVPEELFVPFVAQVKPHIKTVNKREKGEKDNRTKLLHNMILLRQHFQALDYNGAIYGIEFLGYEVSLWELCDGDQDKLPRFSCVAEKVSLNSTSDVAVVIARYLSSCKLISTTVEKKMMFE